MTTTNQTNNFLAKMALLFSGVAIFVCFSLLTNILPYSTTLIILGVVFALPSFVAINQYRLYHFALTINLVALMLLIILASSYLWQSILGHTEIDLITTLLMLILILVLALIWQLLSINFPQNIEQMNFNELINNARKHPSVLITFSIGLILCDLLMLGLSLLPNDFNYIALKIIDRGIIPPITLTIFFWGLLLIMVKWLMVVNEKRQKKNNSYLDILYQRVNNTSEDSSKNKEVALNLLWNQFESFYTLPHYINWAIPILGFIGTVLGISLATEQLGIALSDNTTESGQVLSLALTPLGIAFDTTLIALSLSIVLALLQTLLYRSEAKHLRTLEERFK